ncbi:MAG: GIN domain-containing protein [Janthinobacterium lividum]
MLLQSNALAGLRRAAALLAGSLALAACSADHDTDCLKSNGAVVTERRALDPSLHTVVVYNNVDLTIVPDTVTYAEVRAGEHVLQDIEFSTPSGPQTLVIKNTSRCNWVRSYNTPREVRLHVAKKRTSFDIEQYGYGLISNEGQWAQDTLFLRLWSTGDFNMNVRSTYLYIDSYDAGDITLRGTAEDFHPNFGSNGFLFASDLDARYCYFYTYREWRGDMHVRSHQNLGGTLAGTGRLFYTGNPSLFFVNGPNASNVFKE